MLTQRSVLRLVISGTQVLTFPAHARGTSHVNGRPKTHYRILSGRGD
jgi:hypothetical protein